MACTVTVDLAAVQHTLPTSFFGGATVGWDKKDCDNPNYLDLVQECGYEILRDSMWIHDPGLASPFSEPPVRAEARRLLRNLRLRGETTKLWWCGGAAPNATLSAVTGNSSPYSTANIATDRYGPANHAAMLQHYLADPDFGAGSIFAYAAFNEPATASGTTAGDPWRAWYTAAADGGGGNSRDWATAKTKAYSDAVRAAVPGLPITAWEFAALPAYYAFSSNEFPSFLAPNATRPTAGGVNFPYTDAQHQASFDVVNFHLYGGQFPDDQSTMNAMYFPTWDGVTTQGVNNKSRLQGNMQKVRDLLDAAGLTTKQMAMSEYETPASSVSGSAYFTAAIDAAVGIVSCTMQSAFKIHQFQQFAVTATRSSPIPRNDWVIYWDGVDSNPYNGTTHIPGFFRGVRQYMAHRVLSRYVRNYKRQLIGASNMNTAVVNSANTPGGASANPVGRVRTMAGLPNAANNEVAFVFQNADLLNSEPVNITIQNGTFTGHLLGHRMLKTIAYQNEDFAAVDITPSSSTTASFSLGPGEVVIVVASVSLSGGGGGGGTTFPTTASLDTFTRADQNPIASGWLGPVISGRPQLKLVSNAVANIGALAGSSYFNTLYGADQEAWCDIPALPAANGIGVWCRIQNPGNASTAAGYVVTADVGGQLFLFKLSGTTLTQLTQIAQTPAANDAVGLQVIGSTINVWYRVGLGGTWTLKGTVVDSSVTGPGFVGLRIEDTTTGRADNFGGGTRGAVISTDAPSGTISLGGSRTESAVHAVTLSGTIGVSGIAAGVGNVHNDAPSGSLLLDGFVTESFTGRATVGSARDVGWGGDGNPESASELTRGVARPARGQAWGGGG